MKGAPSSSLVAVRSWLRLGGSTTPSNVNAADKIGELSGNAHCNAIPYRLSVDGNIGETAGLKQLLERCMDVVLAQRASSVQGQQPVELFSGERLRGRVKIDALNGASNVAVSRFESWRDSGCRVLSRRRRGAEQQR